MDHQKAFQERHSAVGYGKAQLCFDHEGELKMVGSVRCEVIAFRIALEKAVLLVRSRIDN